MIVYLSKYLKKAEKERFALPAFNIFNLESARAVINAAENLNSPLILQISETTLKNYFSANCLLPSIISLCKQSKIPIAIHLDHAKSLETVKIALKSGFTSIMFDGSLLPFEKNLKLTKKVVKMAKSKNKKITVEGEIGIIGSEKRESKYTNPNDAEIFVKKTKVDLLAVSIGNVHGLYKGKPKLNFEILKEIKKRAKTFLVLHGASGLPKSQIRKAIELGIVKINFFTDLKLSFTKGLKKGIKKYNDPRKILKEAENEMKKEAEKKIKVVKSFGKI